jgi:hypothetical protein
LSLANHRGTALRIDLHRFHDPLHLRGHPRHAEVVATLVLFLQTGQLHKQAREVFLDESIDLLPLGDGPFQPRPQARAGRIRRSTTLIV